MKKVLLTLSLTLAGSVGAQFSSGVVSLSAAAMTVKLDTSVTTATLTITGDSNSMMGIGFGNSGMAVGADGFIYNSTANRDFTFDGIGEIPIADPSQDWTVTSNTISGSTRTIIAERSLSGGSGDFVIPNAMGNINIFYSRRAGNQALGYHGPNRGYATLNMTATLGTNEVSADSKKIILYPNPAKETVSFKNADKIKFVDIYESTGRKVKSVKLNGESISVVDLKPGNYYFEIILRDGSIAYEKLIKE